MLQAGMRAPAFTLADKDGRMVSLSDFLVFLDPESASGTLVSMRGRNHRARGPVHDSSGFSVECIIIVDPVFRGFRDTMADVQKRGVGRKFMDRVPDTRSGSDVAVRPVTPTRSPGPAV